MSKDEKSTAERMKELKRSGEDDARIDFKVYNMPVNLVQKYISMAKLYYDNQVWRVLKKAMKLLNEEQTSWRERIDKKVEQLEERIVIMERSIRESQKNDKPHIKSTFKEARKKKEGGD